MKEIMKELARLAVMIVIIMTIFFVAICLLALMLNGLEFLPQYIGGFFTFMLYTAVALLATALIIKLK